MRRNEETGFDLEVGVLGTSEAQRVSCHVRECVDPPFAPVSFLAPRCTEAIYAFSILMWLKRRRIVRSTNELASLWSSRLMACSVFFIAAALCYFIPVFVVFSPIQHMVMFPRASQFSSNIEVLSGFLSPLLLDSILTNLSSLASGSLIAAK